MSKNVEIMNIINEFARRERLSECVIVREEELKDVDTSCNVWIISTKPVEIEPDYSVESYKWYTFFIFKGEVMSASMTRHNICDYDDSFHYVDLYNK